MSNCGKTALSIAARFQGVKAINVGVFRAPSHPPSVSASYSTIYVYDQLNQSVGASQSPVQAQAPPAASSSVNFVYSYDATNRRVGQSATDNTWWSYPTTATNVSYTANNLNQYTAVGSASPTYDGNGNLASYAYDAQGRRKSKASTAPPQST